MNGAFGTFVFVFAAGTLKSAARRSNFCCAADELLLHGKPNSAARRIELCKAADFKELLSSCFR